MKQRWREMKTYRAAREFLRKAQFLRFLPGADLRADVDQSLTPMKVTIPGYHPQFIGQAPQVPD